MSYSSHEIKIIFDEWESGKLTREEAVAKLKDQDAELLVALIDLKEYNSRLITLMKK